MEILWQRIRADAEGSLQIVLDEFQELNLEGTAVEEMLREGRKHGLGMVLLSQFPPKSEARDYLEQSSNALYFRPNDRNTMKTARMLSAENPKAWVEVLKKLPVGQCVVLGTYIVNGRKIRTSAPLICRVASKGKS